MLSVAAHSPVFVVETPASFRCGKNGMVGLCREVYNLEPMDGAYIVFRNRTGTQLRVIFYDGDGMWLCTKYFSKGSVKSWPVGSGVSNATARDLAVLLWRGSVGGASFPEFWKKMA